MISEKASKSNREAYVQWIVQLGQYGKEKGLQPVLLLHSRTLDNDLALAISAQAGDTFESIWPEDAYDAKSILGSATFVVASRYHALIGAASQAVPCLCTAWSHKYAAACSDFGLEAFVANPSDGTSKVKRDLDLFTAPESRGRIIEGLKSRARHLSAKIESMWTEILSIVT
jgi:colanic acid/amylovoran biosynthesis protein